MTDTRHLYWTIDDTFMCIKTDAEIPPGQLRTTMSRELKARMRGMSVLTQAYWQESFLGVTGTEISGTGWSLHVPQGSNDLWNLAELASLADWTEVSPNEP